MENKKIIFDMSDSYGYEYRVVCFFNKKETYYYTTAWYLQLQINKKRKKWFLFGETISDWRIIYEYVYPLDIDDIQKLKDKANWLYNREVVQPEIGLENIKKIYSQYEI